MFSVEQVIYAANELGVQFDKYSFNEFFDGMNIELEHGKQNSKTNVTDDDVLTTAKIALAHLNEFPNYYNLVYGLRTFENFLKQKLGSK